MDKIWAPWRKKYITLKKSKRCIFCIGKEKLASDRRNYILKRNKSAFSILNRYPYNNAHVMIAPYRHIKSLELLKKDELLDLMDLLNHTKKKIDKRLKPSGYNIGLNIGKIAGAGFPGHVHIHIVPRWVGDTNFMPVVSDVKIVSYSLDEIYNLLKG
ncbi:MAG: HIT domain-containing protein [Candidatus Omnitrophica bacterium]|nr:HIT domain-containing protein [Candidatus Omnitrophota bacterium]